MASKKLGYAAPAPLPLKPCGWCTKGFRPKFASSNFCGGACATNARNLREAEAAGLKRLVLLLIEMRGEDQAREALARDKKAGQFKVNIAKSKEVLL
jgi:hypothetical protein